MVAEVSDKDINKLAEKMMAQLKTEGDVDAFTKALRKQFWEVSLEGEMDEHLGYSKHETAGNGSGNSRVTVKPGNVSRVSIESLR